MFLALIRRGCWSGRSSSSYEPPTPPPAGFTRSVQEDDEVVCPNCDRELGIGEDDRQQIWVSKQCGHVFCGECAKHRSVNKNKKMASSVPPQTKPFKNCPVPGCGKPISAPKALFQIYLWFIRDSVLGRSCKFSQSVCLFDKVRMSMYSSKCSQISRLSLCFSWPSFFIGVYLRCFRFISDD